MSSPRTAIPQVTIALTRRTTLRKAALGPWDPLVQQGWLYNLAEASTYLDVDVHLTSLVINHHHTSISSKHKNISAFLHRLHQPMSCFVNTLLQQRGFDALDHVWDGDRPHRMRLLDAEAMMTQLIYERVQAVAAGLVDRPEDMPGFVFDWSMWRPGCIVQVDAPDDVYFDLRFRPKTRRIDFRAPTVLLALFDWDVERLIFYMRKLEAIAIKRILRQRTRPCRGAAAVLKIHPFDEPRTRRATRGGTVPSFRIGARGMVARETRIISSLETTAFREEHRQASLDFREGNRERVFPYGTDKMAQLYGVRVEEEPKPGALLIAPGPSEEQLRALQSDSRAEQRREELHRSLENVKNALDDEAPSFERVCEAANFVAPRSFDARTRVTSSDIEDMPMADDEVDVQTLRGRRRASAGKPPRRIVVLRTRYETLRSGARRSGSENSASSGRRASDEPDD